MERIAGSCRQGVDFPNPADDKGKARRGKAVAAEMHIMNELFPNEDHGKTSKSLVALWLAS